MSRTVNKLNAAQVAKLTAPGVYGDGGGLYLQVANSTSKDAGVTKSWLFRFMLAGKARYMGLGDLKTFSLREARDRARNARQMVAEGIDPIDARRAQKDALRSEASKRITFKDAAERYIKAHQAGWKNAKHADQWRNTLATYAYPVIGNLPVDKVDTAHVLQILEPIWAEKSETASRVRGRIESILDWAKARHFRSGENPARWRGHMDKLLPSRSKVTKVQHHPAMPYKELPAFMKGLRETAGISARALEFTILTAVRTGETINARWQEFDLAENGLWTIPGDRTKSGREHRVPLTPRVIEILQSAPREEGSDFVFPGARLGRGLSNMAMLELLRGMERASDYTVHGFRSSFRDWVAECTEFPREVAEAALAHVLSDKTEAAYQRGDLLQRRRRLMEAWALYCG